MRYARSAILFLLPKSKIFRKDEAVGAKALFDIANEVVCITGVSGRLGSEYAKAFLERGAKVVGLDTI